MNKQAKSRERLQQLASSLLEQIQDAERRIEREGQRLRGGASELPLPYGCWIGQDDAVWLANAIRDFLDDAKTLERALGLTAPKGRPRDPKNVVLCEVWAENIDATLFEIAGKAWERREDLFGDTPPDERQVRRAIGEAGALSQDALDAISRRMQAGLEGGAQGHK